MSKILLVESAVMVRPQPADLKESKARPGYVVESAGPSGLMRVKLPATTLDQKNENGRNYATKIMEGACVRTQPAFEGRELLSSVNEHPEEPYVTPGQASHIVTKAWCEGGYLWNEWEVLNTGSGKDLQALIEAGAAFGVSIRGLGSMDNYGNIQEDYEYLGTDCVGQPSARIRTNPVAVKESASGAPATPSATLNESAPQGHTTMKTKEAALKFVREQVTLMKTESLIEAAQRVMAAEGALAAASVPAKDLAECFQVLDAAKADLQAPKAALGESAGETVASLKAKLEAVNAASRTQIGKLAEQFKASQKALNEQLAAAAAQLEKSEKGSKFFKAKYETLLTKHAAVIKEGKGDPKLKAKYEALLKRTSQLVVGFQSARAVAVESTAKYGALLKIAGKMVKESKKPVAAPAATAKPVKEAATAPASSVKDTFLGERKVTDRKPVGERHVTAANRAGATNVPGFI
jgi:hypothetical protein